MLASDFPSGSVFDLLVTDSRLLVGAPTPLLSATPPLSRDYSFRRGYSRPLLRP